jgi:hypothetical protein
VVAAAKPKTDHLNLSAPAASAEPIIVLDNAKGKVFNRNAAIHHLKVFLVLVASELVFVFCILSL